MTATITPDPLQADLDAERDRDAVRQSTGRHPDPPQADLDGERDRDGSRRRAGCDGLGRMEGA